MSLGIHGYISKKYPTDQILEKMNNLIEKISETDKEKRKHIRIDVPIKEAATCNFHLEAADLNVEGRIMNISMGGILFALKKYDAINYIGMNLEIPNVQIKLGKWIILCDVVVVGMYNNKVSIKFLRMKKTFQENIAKYIFNKIANY